MVSQMTPSATLAWRELIRFLRQRNRVIGALATPIVFWLLIGAGMGQSFTSPDGSAGYLSYFFPGTVLMILLFTAIFSTISVIEDRREGFLQGVLVAPVGRISIVNGKVLGGAILATGQATLFLILGWASGIFQPTLVNVVATLGVMFVIAIGLTALGLCIAWPLSSTQGFHALMNLLLMPMWFLSGALFPIRDDTPLLLRGIMKANPLTSALASLRQVMREPTLEALASPLAITFGFTVAMLVLATIIAHTRTRSDSI